jgi:hypothetical protein
LFEKCSSDLHGNAGQLLLQAGVAGVPGGRGGALPSEHVGNRVQAEAWLLHEGSTGVAEHRFAYSNSSVWIAAPASLVAVQLVGLEDRPNITQTVACDRCNVGLGAADEPQPAYGSPAEVIERNADDICLCAGFAPGGPEAVRCPRCASIVVRMIGLRLFLAPISSVSFNGGPAGIVTSRQAAIRSRWVAAKAGRERLERHRIALTSLRALAKHSV